MVIAQTDAGTTDLKRLNIVQVHRPPMNVLVTIYSGYVGVGAVEC